MIENMKDSLFYTRNLIGRTLYKYLLKPALFKFDPETIHDFFTTIGRFMGKYSFTRFLTTIAWNYENKQLRQNILGVDFRNPIGLSAGFDKDANLTDIMSHVGFGFMEIGSITAKPYEGNKKPRLYRLPEQKSLRVNYGLKNLGASVIYENLKNKKFDLPIGVNIAKTNHTDTSDISVGIEDYFFTYKTFQNVGDYFTINISCPNTCEEHPIFATPENLDLLLQKIFSIPKVKPVFIKISPDLPTAQLEEILNVCMKHKIDGYVCTNLTKINTTHHNGKGGFSGKLVDDLANKTIKYVYKKTAGQAVIIGVGGVFNARDAYEKIKAGASLIELITGMIYEGPQTISSINMGLVKLLKKDGFKNISEAVGKE